MHQLNSTSITNDAIPAVAIAALRSGQKRKHTHTHTWKDEMYVEKRGMVASLILTCCIIQKELVLLLTCVQYKVDNTCVCVCSGFM